MRGICCWLIWGLEFADAEDHRLRAAGAEGRDVGGSRARRSSSWHHLPQGSLERTTLFISPNWAKTSDLYSGYNYFRLERGTFWTWHWF